MSIFSPSETKIRLLIAGVGLLGAFFAPWWVPLICMLALSLRYPAWEVPLIGLVVDMLWLPGDGFHYPVFTLVGIVFVWLCAPLRAQFLQP